MGTPAQPDPVCRVCGGESFVRVRRQGFMKLHVFPLFALFPWRCAACDTGVMIRKRKKGPASNDSSASRPTDGPL